MRNGSATAQSAKDIQKELRALKAKLADLAESIQEDAGEAAHWEVAALRWQVAAA